jgi:hypothetical protein
MLKILNSLDANALPVQYVATADTLENLMFGALQDRCRASEVQAGQDIEFEGVVLRHGTAEPEWVSLQSLDTPDRLVMVNFKQANGDCVWVACTDRSWLSFILMLYSPSV